jgi:hypothetical protein
VIIDLEALTTNPQNKAELIEWCVSDADFLFTFLDLLAQGATKDGSWPADLGHLRQRFHEIAGDDYLAERVARINTLEADRNAERGKAWDALRRLKEIAELLPVVMKRTGDSDVLTHDKTGDGKDCRACRFLKLIRGE